MKKFIMLRARKTAALLVFLFLLAGADYTFAAMHSTNFGIDSDVIGASGGLSGSASYQVKDTMGEPVIGESASASFQDKAGFWYMGPAQVGSGLGLTCKQSNVYLEDYALGSSSNNYKIELISSSQDCTVSDNSASAWDLTLASTNMTSTNNNISNTNILLEKDGNVTSGLTVTDRNTGITETAGEYALNAGQTIIHGDNTATGNYENQPSIKIQYINNLHSESTTGTMTFTVS